MNSFEGLSLSQGLNKALKKIDFKEPTPIQAKAIPLAIEGKDILGSAQTGTGKTAAFSIPLIESLLTSDQSTALVLTPTRELAKQVMEVISSLLSDLNHINMACLIGGEQMTRQLKQLKKRPRNNTKLVTTKLRELKLWRKIIADANVPTPPGSELSSPWINPTPPRSTVSFPRSNTTSSPKDTITGSAPKTEMVKMRRPEIPLTN